MGSVSISYRIKLSVDVTEVFDFELDDKTFDLISSEIVDPPKWTRLDFSQCSHCPLNIEEHPYCPLALQLYDVVNRFHDTTSIDEVEMEVITEDRKVIQTTAIQHAIASMLDLIFPICGCPKTAHMKPLSRFHLPLASEEETVFRVTGMYLLAQYFLSVSKKGGKIEFSGLTKIYDDMHILNVAVARRLQSATQSDSSKNAITLLDMYSSLVPVLLEDELAEMRGFFKAYLPEGEEEIVSTNYFEKAKAFSLELEPIGGSAVIGSVDKDYDDRPEWLKQLRPLDKAITNQVDISVEKKPVPAQESAAEIILKKSGLTIELESIEMPVDKKGPVIFGAIDFEEDKEALLKNKPKPKAEPVVDEKPAEKSTIFSLSLEPIHGESPATPSGDKPPFSKAKFKLPDE